jgi:large subunit ribosomal protein L2
MIKKKLKITKKKLTVSIRSKNGRNNTGKIMFFTRSGRGKSRLRLVDKYRQFFNIPGKVLKIEKDPLRNTNIALILYKNGFLSYILASEKCNLNNIVISSIETLDNLRPGDCTKLKNIPTGSFVYNIELNPGTGGKLVRSAGLTAKILRQDSFYTYIRLPSGEERLFNNNCLASFGILSNSDYRFKFFLKAGLKRNLGYKPRSRGIARNPVDHPNGGRTKGGGPFKDKWGNLSKGRRTRLQIKVNKLILKSRHMSK